jgi:hypothetical protein
MRQFVRAALPVIATVALLVLGTATLSWAGGPPPAPEIDPATGTAAVALIAGAVLVIRARRTKG